MTKQNSLSFIVAIIAMLCCAPLALADNNAVASGNTSNGDISKLRTNAEKGDATAQNTLGLAYSKGQGVPQDYIEAVKWYRKAADQGDVLAQFNLGIMYEEGQGVPRDYIEVVKWYRKAADQGDAQAQNNLGVMYRNGQGVPQDYTEAVKWFRKAADQGAAQAQNNLGGMYFNGYGVKKDYTESAKWYRKAADQGNVSARHTLGLPQEIQVIVTSQDAKGVTPQQMNEGFLKKLAAYLLEQAKVGAKEYLASKGYPNAEVKLTSEASYLESGAIKLAIVYLKNSDGVKQSAIIAGVTGNEFTRITCISKSTETVPIFYGVCGKKIKDVFGIKIGG